MSRLLPRQKRKGGGVIPESGCAIFLPGQNGIFSYLGRMGMGSCHEWGLPRHCLGTWMGFCPGIWMGFCQGIWMGFWPGTLDEVLPRHMDGGFGFCPVALASTSFAHTSDMDGASSPCRGKHPSRCPCTKMPWQNPIKMPRQKPYISKCPGKTDMPSLTHLK